MNFFQMLRLARLFVLGLVFIGLMIFGLIGITISLIHREMGFYERYGKDWVQEYEKYYGPVAKTNFRIGLGIFGIIAVCVLVWWIYRNIDPYKAKNFRRRRRRRH